MKDWKPIATRPQELGAKFIAGSPFTDFSKISPLAPVPRTERVVVVQEGDDGWPLLSGIDPSMFTHWRPL